MMRVINRELPSPLSDISLGTLLQPNYGGFIRKSLTSPSCGGRRARVPEPYQRDLGRGPRSTGSPAAASGVYSGRGIEHYVEEALADPDRTKRLPAAQLGALPDGHRPGFDGSAS